MKCELARDLIILYAEDLCSKETAKDLEEHLKQCQECSKRLEEYKRELEETKTENAEVDDLQPMKKVKKKLVRGKIKIAILCIVLVGILGTVGYLSYGQITNECMSFSTLADVIKIKSVCKSLVKGDTEPFINILAYRIENQYSAASSKEFNDFEGYVSMIDEGVKKASDYYFAGKDITIKVNGIDHYSYDIKEPADVTKTDFTIGFYEGKELVYEMAFGKVGVDSYIIYEVPQNGEPSFTQSVLPFYDANLDICLHYATKKNYTNLIEKNTDKAGAGIALAITIEGTEEEKNAYRERLLGKMQNLCDEGWYYKDAMYFVDEYDAKAGKWIYKVWFMLEEQSSGKIVMIEQKFHYYGQQLYAMKDSSAVIIGEDGEILEEIKEQMIEIFE